MVDEAKIKINRKGIDLDDLDSISGFFCKDMPKDMKDWRQKTPRDAYLILARGIQVARNENNDVFLHQILQYFFEHKTGIEPDIIHGLTEDDLITAMMTFPEKEERFVPALNDIALSALVADHGAETIDLPHQSLLSLTPLQNQTFLEQNRPYGIRPMATTPTNRDRTTSSLINLMNRQGNSQFRDGIANQLISDLALADDSRNLEQIQKNVKKIGKVNIGEYLARAAYIADYGRAIPAFITGYKPELIPGMTQRFVAKYSMK